MDSFTGSGEKDKKTSSGSKKEQVKGVESRPSVLVPSDEVAQRCHTAASEKKVKKINTLYASASEISGFTNLAHNPRPAASGCMLNL